MTLNIPALTTLAEQLEARSFPSNVMFCMNYFNNPIAEVRRLGASGYYAEGADVEMVNHCGTAACIAGLTKVIFDLPGGIMTGFDTAAYFLGLTDEKYIDRMGDCILFYPNTNDPWSQITPALAAKVVRHLIETGEIDWTLAGVTTFDPSDDA
jgi:hypothetical protein